MVNADEAAVSAAIDGEGIVRILDYKIQQEVNDGRLVILLPDDQPPPTPVHLIASEHRLAVPKVRAFMDFACRRLRDDFRAGVRASREIRNSSAGRTSDKTAVSQLA